MRARPITLQRRHLGLPRIHLSQSRGGLQLGKWMDCKVLATSREPHLRAYTNEPINSEANNEINQAAPVQQKALVAQHRRQVWHERKIIDRVSQKDRDEVFNPTPNWGAKKVESHDFLNDCLLQLGLAAAAVFGVLRGMQRAAALPNSAHWISSVGIGLWSGRCVPPIGTQREALPLKLLRLNFRSPLVSTQTHFRPANRWYKSDVLAPADPATRPDAHRSI